MEKQDVNALQKFNTEIKRLYKNELLKFNQFNKEHFNIQLAPYICTREHTSKRL